MTHTINELCNGCGACFRQCPVSAISGELKGRFDIDEELCIDCSVCGIICPVAAVVDDHGRVVQRIVRNLRPRPVLRADLCNACGLCVDICPFGCRMIVGVLFDGVTSLAHPERCVSCGECAYICIKDAITMEAIDLRNFDPIVEARRLQDYLAREKEPNQARAEGQRTDAKSDEGAVAHKDG